MRYHTSGHLKGEISLKYVLSKQAKKYLASLDSVTCQRFHVELLKMAELKGDIKKLRRKDNAYRYKFYHYRFLFSIDWNAETIYVNTIDSRTNIKY